MIEENIILNLSDLLDVPVYAEEPEQPPERFVVIEKTGGGRANGINTATIAVQSYAGTLYAAAELNEQVKDAMLTGVILDGAIGSIRLNSDYNFTDTETLRYRYQAVFNITHY